MTRFRFLWPVAIVVFAMHGVASAQAPEPTPPGEPTPPAQPQEPGETTSETDLDSLLEDDSLFELQELTIERTVFKKSTAGSAHTVDEKVLEQMEYDDAHSVLVSVPGVYVRQEDGYGLRPNIGLRGANSERSKKVTLLEDGVLLGPAPYSAPAAYYFPLMTRMVGVDVLKGPSAIQHGPNTIGGTINMRSRAIPDGFDGGADVSLGMNLYGKAHLHAGYGGPRWGFLVEGVQLQTDGFKELDGGGDTGFNRSEMLAKGRYQTAPEGQSRHAIELRAGYSRELSRETYLGLTDADFDDNPDRRYRSSALGKMSWRRTQVRADYDLQLGDDDAEHYKLKLSGYRHDFTRAWRKLNRFRDGPELGAILADPNTGRRRTFYDVLTGDADSQSPSEALLIGTNDRTFVSQGVQANTSAQFKTGGFTHRPSMGVRLHHDRIDRDHTEEAFVMTAGELVPEGTPTETTTRNTGEAVAFAAYVLYEITAYNLTLTPGARLEYIKTSLQDELQDTDSNNTNTVVAPGLGAFYAITDELGVLAGVHQGFSPVAPGQPDEVEPEKSTNYEAGTRYSAGDTQLELIGFFNDYSNLTGQCSFSAGCTEAMLARQFNGGAVDVFGLEVLAAHSWNVGNVEVPVRLSYTFTDSSFQTSFDSDNPQFGDVRAGDKLPYVPLHQAALMLGLSRPMWGVAVNTTFVDRMRESAGQDEDDVFTDRQVFVDVAADHSIGEHGVIYVRIDNLLGLRPIVSRRPFGARPGRPLLVSAGIKYRY